MVLLGPFVPLFCELGNFVKILDPPHLFRKISQVKTLVILVLVLIISSLGWV